MYDLVAPGDSQPVQVNAAVQFDAKPRSTLCLPAGTPTLPGVKRAHHNSNCTRTYLLTSKLQI